MSVARYVLPRRWVRPAARLATSLIFALVVVGGPIEAETGCGPGRCCSTVTGGGAHACRDIGDCRDVIPGCNCVADQTKCKEGAITGPGCDL